MSHKFNAPFWRTFTVANPAAGSNLTRVNTGKQSVRLMTAAFTLVTSAAAGTRIVTVSASNGTDVYFRSGASFTQAAGLTYTYGLMSSGSDYGVAGGVLHVPLPVDGLVLLPGWQFTVTVVGILAADQIGSFAGSEFVYPTGPDVEWQASFLSTPYAQS